MTAQSLPEIDPSANVMLAQQNKRYTHPTDEHVVRFLKHEGSSRYWRLRFPQLDPTQVAKLQVVIDQQPECELVHRFRDLWQHSCAYECDALSVDVCPISEMLVAHRSLSNNCVVSMGKEGAAMLRSIMEEPVFSL